MKIFGILICCLNKTISFFVNKQFLSLMEEYCKKSGYKRETVRFMFKGREVFESDTPDLIGMKHGDNIDAYDRLNLFSKYYILISINISYFILEISDQKCMLDTYISV